MANKFHQKMPRGKGPETGRSGPDASVKEKAIGWPGLPGSSQRRDRSKGVKRLKVYPVSKGI